MIGTGISIPFRKKKRSVDDVITVNAPTNLVATVISDTRINLTWTDNSDNEDGFSIERCTDSVNYVEINTVVADVEGYIDTSCVAGTLYYYRVRAFKN